MEALAALKPGDTLVIWRLDRLGRSLSHLIEMVTELGERKIGLYSVNECIDTASAGGVLIFHIMGALAQFERSLISERTRAGMSAARQRGSAIGRPVKLTTQDVEVARGAIHGGSVTVQERPATWASAAPRSIAHLDARAPFSEGECCGLSPRHNFLLHRLRSIDLRNRRHAAT